MQVFIKRVDYRNPRDAADLLCMLREHAQLVNCDRPELSGIADELSGFPTAFSLLAYTDSNWADVIGLTNCFFGFSTFEMRKLVNIHDVFVTGRVRGREVAAAMLAEVERIARANDCCRLTLEVYADNGPALRAYHKYGFTRDPSHPEVDVHFLRKSLDPQVAAPES